ncbi:EAL domain-containing protein [Sphingomonas ginsenosidivorax]|uniref:EAL domain-containing protein n=1 Tax=Sphingomonas ginsenosidivorax TaxID=862135 RepID=UPI001F553FB4|nr:EAL domain-containing protein [Sphingomonas ginsenosidivorax]
MRLHRRGVGIDLFEEDLFLRDVDHTFQKREQLRTLGIQVLMDDFGVCYSLLSYFERFRFDRVKIDQSFVRQMLTSQTSAPIIQSVVGLEATLGMGVVAEGVETAQQMTALVDDGWTQLQGYLFRKPLRGAEIKACLLADTRHFDSQSAAYDGPLTQLAISSPKPFVSSAAAVRQAQASGVA